MGILPPLPEKGEGRGEGGLVDGNVPIGSASLFIFSSSYPSHFGEGEVLFLLPTAKPEAPLIQTNYSLALSR